MPDHLQFAKENPMIKSATYAGPKPVQDPSITPAKPRAGRKRRPSYRELLERLLDSPENSVLRVKNVDSRDTFEKQARALGYEVVFAQDDDWLYIKIRGALNQKQPSTPRPGAAQKSVLEALGHAPMTATEVARVLRSDSATCEAMLTCLVEAGSVERDDGLGNQAIYRAM
jgi:predicted Rossmann fold nucleotide-binding protein DprA/Smf involved in DNA uptake